MFRKNWLMPDYLAILICLVAGVLCGASCVWFGFWMCDRKIHDESVGFEPTQIADVDVPEMDGDDEVVSQPTKVTPA